MKFNSFALAATVALLALVGCNKAPDYGPAAIKLAQAELAVPQAGISGTVALTATVDWAVETLPEWIKVDPMTGGPSTEPQKLTVTVAANDGVERSAVVTVKGGDLKATLNVTQGFYLPEVKDVTVATLPVETYKYQRYRVSGVIKQLTDATNGEFKLVDGTASVSVKGLEKSEVAYGSAASGAFATLGVTERDNVTIVGYLVDGAICYAYLEKSVKYSEPSADAMSVVAFPYAVNLTGADGGLLVNNPVFPFALEAIWTSTANGYTASAYVKGKKLAAESWLFTPFIDLTSAEKPILVFDHIVNYFESIEVAKEQTSVVIRKQGETKWAALPLSFSYPDDLGVSVMTSEDINLSEYIGAKVQLAFKYVSSADKEAGNWTIVNINVKKNEEPAQPDNSQGTEDYNKPGWNW